MQKATLAEFKGTGHFFETLSLAELRSRPIFGGSGSDPSKIKRLRLRLLVYCKAENYEFVTTKKKLFSSMIKNYKVEHVNSVICMGEENIFF